MATMRDRKNRAPKIPEKWKGLWGAFVQIDFTQTYFSENCQRNIAIMLRYTCRDPPT